MTSERLKKGWNLAHLMRQILKFLNLVRDLFQTIVQLISG